MTNDLFIPDGEISEVRVVRRWFRNVGIELDSPALSPHSKKILRDYYDEAGLLRPWRRPFFERHYATTFARTVAFLLGRGGSPVIIDLGCGTGTQTLYFALAGARVIAVDADSGALQALRERKELYGSRARRELDITIVEGNAFEVDYGAYGPADALHSIFAFNMMQPSTALIDRIMPALSDRARVAILDGNRSSWLGHLRRRPTWSPDESAFELEKRGFSIVDHRGGISLPPVMWAILPAATATRLDDRMAQSWFWPISHHLLAELRR